MVGRGGWLDWLAEHFGGSEDTAQLYMRLARHRAELIDPKTEHVRYSTLRAALVAAAPLRKPDITPPARTDEGGDGTQNAVVSPTAGNAHGTLPEARRDAETEAELTQTAVPAAPVQEPDVAPSRQQHKGRDEVPDVAVEGAGQEANQAVHAPSPSAVSRGVQPTFHCRSDLPVAANVLAEALESKRAVVLTCDVPAVETVRQKALKEVKVYLESTVRAAGEKQRTAHLLVLCATDPESREAVERALRRVAPQAKEPLGASAEDTGDGGLSAEEERKRRSYEKRELRKMEKAERSLLRQIILDASGIRTRDDLREEYRSIPNCYKRRDGLPGDEMAEYLSAHHPELGIHSERDLIDALAKRQKR
jgi:hypothetical protein